uniref:Uncharacterized protein n=1 Tax=Hyaloperonospora arabidopsidis (strain Emoy2) TaxID=559515 RepID=M4BDH6_HYAAE
MSTNSLIALVITTLFEGFAISFLCRFLTADLNQVTERTWSESRASSGRTEGYQSSDEVELQPATHVFSNEDGNNEPSSHAQENILDNGRLQSKDSRARLFS